jgi:hypothetical protein
VRISPDLDARLKAAAEERGVSVNVLMTAAFEGYLRRLVPSSSCFSATRRIRFAEATMRLCDPATEPGSPDATVVHEWEASVGFYMKLGSPADGSSCSARSGSSTSSRT